MLNNIIIKKYFKNLSNIKDNKQSSPPVWAGMISYFIT